MVRIKGVIQPAMPENDRKQSQETFYFNTEEKLALVKALSLVSFDVTCLPVYNQVGQVIEGWIDHEGNLGVTAGIYGGLPVSDEILKGVKWRFSVAMDIERIGLKNVRKRITRIYLTKEDTDHGDLTLVSVVPMDDDDVEEPFPLFDSAVAK